MIGTAEVAAYYKRTEPTIRAWAGEFNDYLSPTANPGRGKGRSFTLDDLKVMALVAEMKDRNHTFEDIHVALKSGQRGDPPDMSEHDLKILKATEGEKRAAFEIQALQQHIVDLRERLNRAEERAAEAAVLKEQLASFNTKTEMLGETRDDLQQRLDKAQEQIAELNRQLGREYAQGFKDGLRERGEQSTGNTNS